MPITPDSNLPASIIPGCVVEFMQGDKPQLAWVMEEQSGRLRLLTITKREIKLPSARILSWAGPYYRGQASREEILDALNRHQARRLELEQSIDPMEIWELAQGELDKANLRWFAELLWDKEEAANIEHLAAMGRAMLECKTHFKFQPPEFLIHPKEKVEQRLREQQAMLERERLSSLGRQFFESLWQARTTGALPPRLDDPELAARLEHLLRTRIAFPDDQESEQVWKLVRKGLPEIPHLELLLAQIWGILPPHYNFLYDQADYAPGDAWSAEFPDDIKALAHNLEQTRQEPDPTPFISIDSETTRDVDDAFHLQPLDHGGWLLRLALARPTHGWDMDTPLAKAVAARCTSIYLPEGDSHMLPEELGLGLFSLLEQQDRPALVLEIELAEDEDGVMVQQCCDLRLAWARIAENRSYTQAEADIQDFLEHKQSTWGEMTARAWHLAEKLRDARLRRGAIIIDRQEPEVTLNGLGKDLRVDIRLKTDTPRSQLLVSEFMILANSAIALWAKDRGLALLHRTQDIALPKDSAGIWSAPHEVHQMVKSLTSALLEPMPRPHSSLGVPAYSPTSSPLRRYPDFLNMLQIQRYLQGEEPLYDQQGFESLLPFLSSRLEMAGRVQRFRPRYWKLLYFKQRGKEARYDAVVVDEGPYFVVFSLPLEQLYVRGPRNLFGDKVIPGQRFSIRLGKVDPLNNEVHVIDAEEDESSLADLAGPESEAELAAHADSETTSHGGA